MNIRIIKTSLLIIVGQFIASISTFAQLKQDLFYDADKQPFYGQVDQLLYAPGNYVKVTILKSKYNPGYFTKNDTIKVYGVLYWNEDKLKYQKTEGDFTDVYKTDAIKSFVIGLDSFFVISNYLKSGKLVTKPTYAQYVSRLGNLTFVKVKKGSKGERYLVKEDGKEEWEEFDSRPHKFRPVAQKYFSDDKELMEEIMDRKLTSKDMKEVLRRYTFHYKLVHKEPLQITEYWDITYIKTQARYQAMVESKINDIWKLNFYDSDTLLHTIEYSSLSPIKKSKSTSYNTSGNLKREIVYEKGDPKSVKLFNPSGEVQAFYTLNMEEDKEVLNYAVPSSSSDTIMFGTKTKNYNQTYSSTEISMSFWTNDSTMVYQAVNTDYKVNLKPLNNKIAGYRKDKYNGTGSYYNQSNYPTYPRFFSSWNFNLAWLVEAEGFVMVTFKMDETGLVKSYEFVNTLHNDYTEYLTAFMKSKIVDNHKFKRYKVNGEPVVFEITVPFKFKFKFPEPTNMYNTPVTPMYYGAPTH